MELKGHVRVALVTVVTPRVGNPALRHHLRNPASMVKDISLMLHKEPELAAHLGTKSLHVKIPPRDGLGGGEGVPDQ
jgi:hypothetical protein